MKSIKTIFLQFVSLTLATAIAHSSIAQDYIDNALESPDRTEAMKARDVNRQPAAMLKLSGVKPGDTVVEFAGFGQYYTTLLSQIVGPEGKVHVFDMPYTEGRAGESSRAFAAGHPNTLYTLVDYNEIELPENVDVVFNVLYYHDLPIQNIDTAKLNQKIFDALVPGGVFFIIDHNAEPGSGMRDTQKLHRIDPEVIKEEVTAAGFTLVAQSNLLANSEDDHSLGIRAVERGHTDRSVFKFQKPK